MGFSFLAAKEKTKGLNKAQGIVWDMYNQTREDVKPYRDAGTWAIQAAQKILEAGVPSYTESPGYQFQFSEGQRALNNQAAAAGVLDSSGQQKASIQYGQQMALGDYDRFLGRYYQNLNAIMGVAGMGGNYGVMPSVQANQNASNDLASIAIGKGNAKAGAWTGLQDTLMQGGMLAAYGAGAFGGGASGLGAAAASSYTPLANAGNGLDLRSVYNSQGYW